MISSGLETFLQQTNACMRQPTADKREGSHTVQGKWVVRNDNLDNYPANAAACAAAGSDSGGVQAACAGHGRGGFTRGCAISTEAVPGCHAADVHVQRRPQWRLPLHWHRLWPAEICQPCALRPPAGALQRSHRLLQPTHDSVFLQFALIQGECIRRTRQCERKCIAKWTSAQAVL